MYKVSHSWFRLKKVLLANDIDIQKPLFHACEANLVQSILDQGLRSRAGHGDAYDKNAICFSRSLDFYTSENKALSWTWDKDGAILIFDERDLKTRLRSQPYNFHYESLEEHSKYKYKFRKKEDHEFEERYSVGDFCTSGETSIPAKYIKAIVLKKDLKLKTNTLLLDKTYNLLNSLDYDLAHNKFDISKKYIFKLPQHRNILLENIDHIPKKGSEYLYTQAVKEYDRELVQTLFDHNIEYDYNSFVEACGTSISITKMFIDHGVDPNIDYNSGLLRAVQKSELEIVKLLLAHGANPGNKSLYTSTAINENNLPILKELVKKGFPISESVISDAVFHNNLDMLKYIISFGILPTQEDIILPVIREKIEIGRLLSKYIDLATVDKSEILKRYDRMAAAIKIGFKFDIYDLCTIVSKQRGELCYKLLLGQGMDLNTIPDQDFYNFAHKLNADEQELFVKYGILKNEKFVSYLRDNELVFANHSFA